MALTFLIKDVSSVGDGSVKLAVWDNLTSADATPMAVEFPEWGDRSVQVVGTFNAGTVVMQGSNDGLNWDTLNDAQGNPLSFTVTKIEQILEVTRFLRPKSTGAGMDIDVFVLMRRASGMRT